MTTIKLNNPTDAQTIKRWLDNCILKYTSKIVDCNIEVEEKLPRFVQSELIRIYADSIQMIEIN